MSTRARVFLLACAVVVVPALMVTSWLIRRQQSMRQSMNESLNSASLEREADNSNIPEDVIVDASPPDAVRQPRLAEETPRAGDPHSNRALSEVQEMRKRVLDKNLPSLDEPAITLKSGQLREVMATSIAVILDAQGRGSPRVIGQRVEIPTSKDGKYTMVYNGTMYSFTGEEFPEYDYYWKNRRATQSEVPGMESMLVLIKQRAGEALELLR